MITAGIDIKREPAYENAFLSKLRCYGFTNKNALLPAAFRKQRDADRVFQSGMLKPHIAYGPVIISLLEDTPDILLNFLSTIKNFFKSKNKESESKAFLPGSDVYVVWATSPQDLQRRHQALVCRLKKHGYDETDINFLNILDNNTNLLETIEIDGAKQQVVTMAGQVKSDAKSGGRQALEYIQSYKVPCNATVIQSHFPERAFNQLVSNTDPNQETPNVILDFAAKDKHVHKPACWHLHKSAEQPSVQNSLSRLWSERKIPIMTKILDGQNLFELTNRPLLEILKSFNSFVTDIGVPKLHKIKKD